MIGESINKIVNNKYIRQMLAVSSSNVFAMGVGFFTNLFLAKRMGIHDYGILSFSFAVFNFVAIFMEFGFYSTAAKLLADNKDSLIERKMFGGIIVAYVIINSIFACIMLFLGCYIDDFFDDKVGLYVRNLAILSYAYTAPFFMEWILQGCNKIYLLTSFNITNKLLYLISIALMVILDNLGIEIILYCYSVCIGIAMLCCLVQVRPLFSNAFQILKLLVNKNKVYGWPQYIGRVSSVGAININTLLISFFLNAEAVGHFSLAVAFSRIVSVLSQGLSIAKFKDFASSLCIELSILKIVYRITALSIGIVIALNGLVVFGFLGTDYKPVFCYTILTSLGMAAQAFYTPYNTWLVSRGFNFELRNIALKIALLNVIINPIFTYIGGVVGTCIAFTIGYVYSLYMYKKAYDCHCVE